MAEKAETYTMVLKYKGVFDFHGLYNLIIDWLKDNKYEIQESFKYKNKDLVYEVELKLTGFRKETEYVRFIPKFFIQIWGMKDVEVNGKRLQKGRMKITIDATAELDYSNEYEGSKFLKELRKWYHKYIFSPKYDIGYYWDKLYFHMIAFQNKIKEFLGMYAETKRW